MRLLKTKTILIYALVLFVAIQNIEAQKRKNKDKKSKNKDSGLTFTPKQATDSPEAEYLFIEGMKFYLLEDYTKAITNFEKALAVGGENATVYYKIAQSYSQIKQFSQAERYAKTALELQKDNKYFYVLLAKIYESQERYTDAIQTYENLTENVASSEEYYYNIAQVYEKENNYQKALEAYNLLEAKKGIKASITKRKQEIYLEQNKIDKAIEEGQKLVAAEPYEVKYLVALADLMITQGREEEAMPYLERISEISEYTDPRVYLLLAKIYEDKKNREKVIENLNLAFASPELEAEGKVKIITNYINSGGSLLSPSDFAALNQTILKTHPNAAQAYLLRGDFLLNESKRKEAGEAYLRAVQIDANQADIWQKVLAIDMEAGDSDSLSKHAEQALELFPNQALFWLYSGVGHFGKKNYDEAILAFEQGKRLAFDNPDMQEDLKLYLADTYHATAQYEQAYNAYEDVLEKSPTNPHALNNYSYFLALRKKNLKKAETLAEKLVNTYPEDLNYKDTYGWVLYQSGKYRKAVEYLRQAANNLQSGTVAEHYGDALFKLGQREEALIQWQKAKKLGGASELIDKKISNKNLYE